MATERDVRFSSWLATHLKEMSVTHREIAKWLGIDPGAVNRRLTGQRPFRRDELEIIDRLLGEHGALLRKAGYIPDDASSPRSKYLDEEWLLHRLKEEAVLFRYASVEVALNRIEELLAYLESVHEQEYKLVKKYKTLLKLDKLDLLIGRFGMDSYLLNRAGALGKVVQQVDDNELSYVYETAMTIFSSGVNDYEQALVHDQRALRITDSLERPVVAHLQIEISIIDVLTHIDPWNPEAEEKLETVKAALYVPRYIGNWPEIDEPSYLDVLQVEFNLRLEQAGPTSEAGDILTTILNNFLYAPSTEDTITSLLCAAEFYALDGQKDCMENYLNEVQPLIEQRHWFDGEVERIKEVFNRTIANSLEA
jgi:hypothetical protein